MKKILCILLILLMISPITAFAEDNYLEDYTEWNQSQSEYSIMQAYGCKVVAMAKLVVEAGIVSEDDFNPDDMYDWLKSHYYFDSDGISLYTVANREALGFFAEENDARIEYLEDRSGICLTGTDDLIWENIEKGYLTIVQVKQYHWMMIDNETSKEEGEIYGYESATTNAILGSVNLNQPQYAFISIYTYKSITQEELEELQAFTNSLEITRLSKGINASILE